MSKLLPKANESESLRKRRQTQFSGLDLRAGASEGSLRGAVNMTVENYPVLSSRRPFGIKASFNSRGFYGFGFSEKLYYCAEAADGEAYFYYDGEPYFTVSGTEKTFAKVNGYICVFPDKKYFYEGALKAKNLEEPAASLEELHDKVTDGNVFEGGDIYIAGDGVYSYNPAGVWDTLTASKDELPFSHQAQTEWIYISDLYGSLETDEAFGTRDDGVLVMSASASDGGDDTVKDYNNGAKLHTVKTGDAVTLTIGFYRSKNKSYIYKKYDTVLTGARALGTYYNYKFSGLSVPKSLDENGEASASGAYKRYTARITKRVPDLKAVFVHDNRLWGFENSKIYASALGDPTVFGAYTLSASSAWTLASVSEGSFTGACSFAGYPTFFKENMIIRISGDYPAEYTTYETRNVPGVKKGCNKSLAASGESLFYVSDRGICRYGGAFPRIVSEELGKKVFSDVFAGADGENVYFSTDGVLYCYDVRRGMWICFGEGAYSFFANDGGFLYAFSEDEGKIYELSGNTGLLPEQGAVLSEAELNPIYFGTLNKKITGRIAVSLDTEENARVELYIKYDKGKFERLWSTEKSGVYHIPVKLRRCECFSLKVKGRGRWHLKAVESIYSRGTRI